MLLVTRGHHELDEEKVPDQASLSDIGQVWCTLILRKKAIRCCAKRVIAYTVVCVKEIFFACFDYACNV